MKKLINKLWQYLKPFANIRFLVSFGIAWLITNGWSYAFIIIGTTCKIKWMAIIGTTYASFLYLPFTAEKIITIPLAIFIHTRLFKNDEKTKAQLEQMYAMAKDDWQTIKEKFFTRRKKK